MKTKSKLEYELEYRLHIYEKLCEIGQLNSDGIAILKMLRELAAVKDGDTAKAMDPFLSQDDDPDWG